MGTGKQSAGLLMFRRDGQGIELFLVHPGGPHFSGKDDGVWSIPKGEFESGEKALSIAEKEFQEETGQPVSACRTRGEFIELGSIQQRGGKIVQAWAFEGDWPAEAVLESNQFSMEWPPSSGRTQSFPEVDRGEFFPASVARRKINPAQVALIDRLLEHLGKDE